MGYSRYIYFGLHAIGYGTISIHEGGHKKSKEANIYIYYYTTVESREEEEEDLDAAAVWLPDCRRLDCVDQLRRSVGGMPFI